RLLFFTLAKKGARSKDRTHFALQSCLTEAARLPFCKASCKAQSVSRYRATMPQATPRPRAHVALQGSCFCIYSCRIIIERPLAQAECCPKSDRCSGAQMML